MMHHLSFTCLYLCVTITTSVVLIYLAIIGPPPPSVRDSKLPTQQTIPVMIMGSPEYGFWTKEVEQRWESTLLLPANGGAVVATNLTSGFHLWAMPAMFHQLACLRDIRRQFWKMSKAWDESFVLMNQGGGAEGQQKSEYERLSNCFDFIRQGLLCHADTTLNPVATMLDGGIITDGNILWHTCKDNQILYNWAEASGKPRKDPLIHEQWEIESVGPPF